MTHDTYTIQCERCGWIGSSALVIEDTDPLGGDVEIICPSCHRPTLANEHRPGGFIGMMTPEQQDAAKRGCNAPEVCGPDDGPRVHRPMEGGGEC